MVSDPQHPERAEHARTDGRHTPEISVIIPSFNYGHYLSESIESVLRQDCPDVEVIIVDDGSTDDTPTVAARYADRVRYVRQPNRGLSAARNTGLRHATGAYIQFLDADDLLGPDTLRSQRAFLQRHPHISIAVCENLFFRATSSNGKPKAPSMKWPLLNGDQALHLCHFNIAPPHAFFCRRAAVLETGWFDESLAACEDYDFWLRAAARGFVPAINLATSVYYRRHATSMSARLDRQYTHDALLHQRLAALLDAHPDFPRGNRFPAILAFCAGAVTTAARLAALGIQDPNALLELAIGWLEEARELAPDDLRRWSRPALLYFLWTLAAAERRSIRRRVPARAIHTRLLGLAGGTGHGSIAATAIRSALLPPSSLTPVRRLLARTALRRFGVGLLGPALFGRLRPSR